MPASDRLRLGQAIAHARKHADMVVCLVHWGEENTSRTTEEQRSLARWLVDTGVDIVAGSHPHRIQPLDFYHGHPIAYSLGNLVFDGANGVQGWQNGELLEIGVPENSGPPLVNVIPVHLDNAGFPEPGQAIEVQR
jgi:poly-gamma-glutamate synthesis protein (capsule biosynthesis protein)